MVFRKCKLSRQLEKNGRFIKEYLFYSLYIFWSPSWKMSIQEFYIMDHKKNKAISRAETRAGKYKQIWPHPDKNQARPKTEA